MRIGWGIAVVTQAELELARQLLAVGDRHAAEVEVFHVGRRLAELSRRNVEALAPSAERYEATTAVIGGTVLPADGSDPHVGLLRDLRHLHVLAAGVVLDWTVLGQGAKAARDAELVAVVARATTQTARTVKWTTTLLKTSAPQALTS